jgi:hypothetical protein
MRGVRYKYCHTCRRLQEAWGSTNDPKCVVCEPEVITPPVSPRVVLKVTNHNPHPVEVHDYRAGSLMQFTTPKEPRDGGATVCGWMKGTGLRVENLTARVAMASMVLAPPTPVWRAEPVVSVHTLPPGHAEITVEPGEAGEITAEVVKS